MENRQFSTLYQSTINFNLDKRYQHHNKNTSCCCITDHWCFEHSGIAGFNNYDEDKNNCCTCLDCCTWCLEFKYKKPLKCIRDTNCYICCFAIYFT